METLVTLSDENWAELRPIKDIPERLRRPIGREISQLSAEGLAAMQQLVPFLEEKSDGNVALKEGKSQLEELVKLGIRFSEADLTRLSSANDYCIIALVVKWSFDKPITLDSVLDLKAEDYDKLRIVCAPAAGALFVDFSVSKDPNSPFGRSNGSATPSPEGSPSTSASPMPSGETTSS